MVKRTHLMMINRETKSAGKIAFLVTDRMLCNDAAVSVFDEVI